MRVHPLTVTSLYGSPEPGRTRAHAPTARGVVAPSAPARTSTNHGARSTAALSEGRDRTA